MRAADKELMADAKAMFREQYPPVPGCKRCEKRGHRCHGCRTADLVVYEFEKMADEILDPPEQWILIPVEDVFGKPDPSLLAEIRSAAAKSAEHKESERKKLPDAGGAS